MSDPLGPTADSAIDAVRLAAVMRAFANPMRIEILRQLKAPRTLGEIRIQPTRKGGGRADRAVSRVTVKHHLEQLLEIGAVQIRRLRRGNQELDHYLVDHRQLFVLAEELHRMARIRPHGDVIDGTAPMSADAPSLQSVGPKLVLVNGTYEGKVFPLEPQKAAWTVGRRNDATVALDHDPYVSLDNALLVKGRSGALEIRDVAAARNRVRVNWVELAPGASLTLRRGDLVGIGRSLLLFLDA